MRIGIKIGSSLLANGNGGINEEFILELCRQVAKIVKRRHEVFIVSSGAVACDPQKSRSKNLRAGIGQLRLMSRYVRFFEIFKIEISQHLLTDREIIEENSAITKRTLLEAMSDGIVPIINGNDTVDDKELKALEICADNDVLFRSVCQLINTDIAIIGFNEAGIIGPDGKKIDEVQIGNIEKILSYVKEGNELGYGQDGMKTKIEVLAELCSQGISSFLAPGRESNFIFRILKKENGFGTRFVS